MLGLAAVLWGTASAQGADMVTVNAGSVRVSLDERGNVTALMGPAEYLPPGRHGALLRLTVKGESLTPSAARWDPATGRLTLIYGTTAEAEVQVREKPTHATFALSALRGVQPTQIDWGPVPTTITDTVGETVGVVRDGRFAIGVQALNIQTTAGAGRQGDVSLLFGQALERDGGVLGSGIALFGCPADQALSTLGEVEVAEGLPHPMLDGQWGKVSPTARMPYLICPFGEGNLDEVLALAQRGGFRHVYHPGPFETWGHFRLNPREFPDGDESLRRCAEKAARLGLRLGVHTLTSFITTNDPYVTPVPDPRLARLGSTVLASAIEAQATEIPIADAGAMQADQPWGWSTKLAIVGDEIVTYEGVSTTEPSRLLGCARGAFGTSAASHSAGADIGRLATHNYRTVYPGIDNNMLDEMTGRLVELVNRAPLHLLSFDGLEGLWSYGHGPWAGVRFVTQCFSGWQPEVMSDASGLLHYTWHVHSRMNWGELTQSAKTDVDVYRSNNCRYFEANLFPKAMGWWRFGGAALDWEATRMEDVEYLLAKAAGNDATHGLQTDPASLAAHGLGEECLEAVHSWSDAQRAGAFSAEQRAKLREKGRDFRLEPAGDGQWNLTEVVYSPLHWLCPGSGRQTPVDPNRDVLSFTTADEAHLGQVCRVRNPFGPQPLRFELRALGSLDHEDPRNILLSTMPPEAFGWERDLHDEAPRLQVSAATVAGRAGYGIRADYPAVDKPSYCTRVIASLGQPLNLQQHRGLGIWVRGDGQGELLFLELVARDCKRQYYVPIDFTGERYFEFPLGEMCLGRYYAYDWNHWSGFASWWVTLKGFDYGQVDRLTLGLNRIPPGRSVACAVAGVQALKELGTSLLDPSIALDGAQLAFSAVVPPGGYLLYQGGAAGEVRDANYRLLATVPPQGAPLTIPQGDSELRVAYSGDGGPAPWSRWEFSAEGDAEPVPSPGTPPGKMM